MSPVTKFHTLVAMRSPIATPKTLYCERKSMNHVSIVSILGEILETKALYLQFYLGHR